jgi:Tol biopolymer transport system component
MWGRVWSSLLVVGIMSLCVAAGTASAAFPGANGRIAFERYSNPSLSVTTTDAGGGGAATLVDGARSPAWSSDGTKIAYVRSDAPEFESTIYVANADGTGEQRVGPDYDDPPGGPDFGYFTAIDNPAWSPDGRSLVYDRNVTICGGHACVVNPEGIWRINVDGTGEQPLAEFGNHPAWSPDGTKVAFDTGIYFYNAGDIAVVGADGRGEDRITNTEADEREPNWSPDGTTLVFSSTPTLYSYEPSELKTIRADGTFLTSLTDGSAFDVAPAWSPDGTKVVFESSRGGGGLYTVNADGTGLTRLPASGPQDVEPDWQPLVGPRREDFKNAAHFCKAERSFMGEAAFAAKYGGGANAHGKCVGASH